MAPFMKNSARRTDFPYTPAGNLLVVCFRWCFEYIRGDRMERMVSYAKDVLVLQDLLDQRKLPDKVSRLVKVLLCRVKRERESGCYLSVGIFPAPVQEIDGDHVRVEAMGLNAEPNGRHQQVQPIPIFQNELRVI